MVLFSSYVSGRDLSTQLGLISSFEVETNRPRSAG